MNEIRDLIVGIDFGKETTQICYYDRKAQEARSLSVKVGASLYESPAASAKGRSREITAWGWRRNILPGKKAGFFSMTSTESVNGQRRSPLGERRRSPGSCLLCI